MVADDAASLGAHVDEGHVARASGEGLEAQCAGAGKEIEHAHIGEHGAQPAGEDVEHRFAYAVGGGPNAVIGW